MNFKTKPWWLRIFTPKGSWVTIAPNIYFPVGTNPTGASCLPVIVHEKKHFEQQQSYGKWKWLLRYCFNKKFRLEQEVEAIVEQLAATPSPMRDFVISNYGTALSSWNYWWCATHQEAVRAIKDAWFASPYRIRPVQKV